MDFPGELLIRMLQFCNSQEILRFSGTCRRFLELVRGTASLQLQIELEANRLQVADHYVQTNQHELLEALKRYRDNWLDLRLDRGQPISLTPGERKLMRPQLHNGLFGDVYSKSDLAGGSIRADAIQLILLDEPESGWNITFDVIFHQFTMDPTQDLIVLASIDEADWSTLTLRFCSLKTGLAHPLAEQPLIVLQIEFTIYPSLTYDTISILVAGELLVLNLVSSGLLAGLVLCDVLIIDWRIGALLSHMGIYGGFCSTTYLGSGRLAVFTADMTGPRTNGLMATSMNLSLFNQICTPRDESPWQDNNVCDVSACPRISPALDLKFPTFQPGTGISIYLFGARSAPPLGKVAPCRSKFVPDPWCQVLGLTMRVFRDRTYQEFIIFVDAQRILHHLPRASPQTSTEPLPWEAWGEYATRWIEVRLIRHTMYGFHGPRFVTGQYLDGDAQLIVADFNPVLFKRLNARELARNSPEVTKDKALTHDGWPRLTPDLQERRMVVENVDEGTPTVVEGYTETPIMSRLPYRVAVVGGPSIAYDDWMIDGNRLIGLEVCPLVSDLPSKN
ncbi:hypothetical protein FRC06_003963 [Ceratobasidium sp. 370]|nr:hypothetical protein FRC06_003963 [Ceratobasidium sp. 370]